MSVAGAPLRVLGRYALHDEIASGGMATVHLGRLSGPAGFARTVAIKRLYPQFAKDAGFAAMFVDEARLVARIRHPNVVQTLDVIAEDNELFLVMEYVHGASLAGLLRASVLRGKTVPPAIASTVMASVLHGLHAAHIATSEQDEPLGIVHRDVSPHNILVGADGVARVLDFGVAKAAGRLQTTRDGQLKGKMPYMAPEQIATQAIAASDTYAAAVVLWEALAARRLFTGENEATLMSKILGGAKEPPSRYVADVPPELDAIAMRGLALEASQRFATARAMARELERASPMVPASEVGEWVEGLVGGELAARARRVKEMEGRSGSGVSSPGAMPVSRGNGAIAAESADRPVAATGLGDATQMSSGSISSPNARPQAKPNAAMMFVAIAAAAGVVGALAAVAFTRSSNEASAPEASVNASGNVTTPPLPAAPPSAVPSAAPPDEPRDIALELPASPSDGAAPASPSPNRAQRSQTRCNPPYVDDPKTGKRKWKAACLR